MYRTFDTLPILNWHLLNKTGDLSYLLQDKNKVVSKSELFQAYDNLLKSDGGIEFRLQYLYFNAFRLAFENLLNPSPPTENKYNLAFDKYLLFLNKEVKEDINQLWDKYFSEVGYIESLKYGCLEFDYHKFTFEDKKNDLFSDIAKMSRGLGYQIDPSKTSVNAYKSIVKDFNNIAKSK